MSLHHDLKNTWRSAEDIHQAKFKKARTNDFKPKEHTWKVKPNFEKQQFKCNNVHKGKKIAFEKKLILMININNLT